MATFITLVNFTDQGARTIKDSPDRFEAFEAMAAAKGIKVKSFFYTTGAHDMLLITEGESEAMMAVSAKLAAAGNIRTLTTRGFSVAEMRKILAG